MFNCTISSTAEKSISVIYYALLTSSRKKDNEIYLALRNSGEHIRVKTLINKTFVDHPCFC